jgi:HNH endonuclease
MITHRLDYFEFIERLKRNSMEVFNKRNKTDIALPFGASFPTGIKLPIGAAMNQTKSPANIEKKRKRYENVCWYCGDPGQTFDHIHPLGRRGSNSQENLCFSCIRCNNLKGRYTTVVFFSKLALFEKTIDARRKNFGESKIPYERMREMVASEENKKMVEYRFKNPYKNYSEETNEPKEEIC